MNNPIDNFYETNYTSNTSTGITNEYYRLYDRIPCIKCSQNPVDIKPSESRESHQLFAILRKRYCFKCWLKTINS